jgi:hypothetical protein
MMKMPVRLFEINTATATPDEITATIEYLCHNWQHVSEAARQNDTSQFYLKETIKKALSAIRNEADSNLKQNCNNILSQAVQAQVDGSFHYKQLKLLHLYYISTVLNPVASHRSENTPNTAAIHSPCR